MYVCMYVCMYVTSLDPLLTPPTPMSGIPALRGTLTPEDFEPGLVKWRVVDTPWWTWTQVATGPITGMWLPNGHRWALWLRLVMRHGTHALCRAHSLPSTWEMFYPRHVMPQTSSFAPGAWVRPMLTGLTCLSLWLIGILRLSCSPVTRRWILLSTTGPTSGGSTGTTCGGPTSPTASQGSARCGADGSSAPTGAGSASTPAKSAAPGATSATPTTGCAASSGPQQTCAAQSPTSAVEPQRGGITVSTRMSGTEVAALRRCLAEGRRAEGNPVPILPTNFNSDEILDLEVIGAQLARIRQAVATRP